MGLRFVYRHRPAADLAEIQLLDCAGRFLAVGHFDEGEAAGAARIAIHNDIHGRDLPVLGEGLAQLVLVGGVR